MRDFAEAALLATAQATELDRFTGRADAAESVRAADGCLVRPRGSTVAAPDPLHTDEPLAAVLRFGHSAVAPGDLHAKLPGGMDVELSRKRALDRLSSSPPTPRWAALRTQASGMSTTES